MALADPGGAGAEGRLPLGPIPFIFMGFLANISCHVIGFRPKLRWCCPHLPPPQRLGNWEILDLPLFGRTGDDSRMKVMRGGGGRSWVRVMRKEGVWEGRASSTIYRCQKGSEEMEGVGKEIWEGDVADLYMVKFWTPPYPWFNFPHFRAVFSRIWPNNRFGVSLGWRPLLGNPGSATARVQFNQLMR